MASRIVVRSAEGCIEAAAGTQVRFLLDVVHWGKGTLAAALSAESPWPVQVTPAALALEPGLPRLAAVRVGIPEDAQVGERQGVRVTVRGGRRPARRELEVVVARAHEPWLGSHSVSPVPVRRLAQRDQTKKASDRRLR